jgi:hypothetical protein
MNLPLSYLIGTLIGTLTDGYGRKTRWAVVDLNH